MKQILTSLLFLSSLLFIAACQQPNMPTNQMPPTLVGTQDIYHILGQTLPDYLEGIQAFDDETDISHLIIIDDSEVLLSEVGIYQLVYHVTNRYKQTTTVSISVVVMPQPGEIDTTGPQLMGPLSFYYYIGDELPNFLEGVTAFDAVDGYVTEFITYDIEAVDFSVSGTYDILYTVFDTAQNQSTLVIPIEVIDPTIVLIETLNIYYINDTHGAVLENGGQMGMARIGNLIMDEKDKSPENTLFIGGGDLLQGTMISNYFYGESMMHLLDHMGMDAFVIGNHEFDWGLEVVTDFFNPNHEGYQVKFPLLGANVFIENTTIRPDFIEPYTVIQKGQIKVGIIGLMGFGLESSIATSRIEGYYFADPVLWTAHYARELRELHQVDIVIATIHGDSDFTNAGIGNLSGDARVDAVFNGHRHQVDISNYQRAGLNMPIIQSGANGTHVGKLTLHINQKNQISSLTALNLNSSNEPRLRQAHPELTSIVNMYYDAIEHLYEDVIINSGSSYTRNELSEYMATLIRKAADADIGIHNYGGTRASLGYHEGITVATLYDIFPFDNKIKVVTLRGSIIRQFISSGADQSAVSFTQGYTLGDIQDHLYYRVATNDYVFDKPSNPFIYGDDIIDTGLLIRDVLETVLRNQSEESSYFYVTQPIILYVDTYIETNFNHKRKHFM